MSFVNWYKYNISLCCINKDENEYLAEWIDYHYKIGVEHFFIYDNASKIPLKETVSTYIKRGIATVIDFPGQQKQMESYDHCLKTYSKKTRWLGFIDMDEFIVPKSPMGDLRKFLKKYENYGGLGINWLLFGSSGHLKRTNKPLLESFIRRSSAESAINDHIKTIIQTKYTKSIGNNPHYFIYKHDKYCVNEKFEKINDAFSRNSTEGIQLNHYYCRSFEEYQQKILRGRADADIQRTIQDFHNHDRGSNEVEDTTVLNILNN